MARALFLLATLGLAALASAQASSSAGETAPTGGATTPYLVTLKWDGAKADADCKAVGGKYTYAGKLDITYAYGDSGAQQGTIGADIDAVGGTWSSSNVQLPASLDNAALVAAAQKELKLCCIPSNPDSALGNKFRCIPGGPSIPYTVTVTPSSPTGPSTPSGAASPPAGPPLPNSPPSGPPTTNPSGYPVCPVDKVLEYQNVANGQKYWGYAGTTAGAYWTRCAGCPAGGDPAWIKEWATGMCTGGGAPVTPPPSGATGPTGPSGPTGPTTPTTPSGAPSIPSGSGSVPSTPPLPSTPPTTSAYPLCPKDKALTYVKALDTGKHVWKADGVECSGCPGEGYLTVWDATTSTCKSKTY